MPFEYLWKRHNVYLPDKGDTIDLLAIWVVKWICVCCFSGWCALVFPNMAFQQSNFSYKLNITKLTDPNDSVWLHGVNMWAKASKRHSISTWSCLDRYFWRHQLHLRQVVAGLELSIDNTFKWRGDSLETKTVVDFVIHFKIQFSFC